MSKKGFTAFDLSVAVNAPGSQAEAQVKENLQQAKRLKEKQTKEERVQRAVYFPKSVDDELRRWAFEDNTQITKLVIQAVREFGERRK